MKLAAIGLEVLVFVLLVGLIMSYYASIQGIRHDIKFQNSCFNHGGNAISYDPNLPGTIKCVKSDGTEIVWDFASDKSLL